MKAPRIVSLCPSNTEIIHALGMMEHLVGVDDWSDWPPQVSQLPRLGPDLQIDFDRVEALQPDLILASLSVPGMERNVQGCVARGLPHMVLDPHSLGEIWSNMRQVGEALGVRHRADAVVTALQERVERIRGACAGLEPFRLYWEWWPRPIYTPGRRNWLTELSETVGCQNIYADHDCDNVRVDDPIEVVRREPDFVLLAWTGARRPDTAHVYRRSGWDQLEAVRQRRVFIMEEGLFNRPSPRLVDGLEHLYQIIRQ